MREAHEMSKHGKMGLYQTAKDVTSTTINNSNDDVKPDPPEC
jgi:hypothetical protein